MKTAKILITGSFAISAFLSSCGGGSTTTDQTNAPAANDPASMNPVVVPVMSPVTTTITLITGTQTITTPTINCDGQNGSINVPRAPGVLTGRALGVEDLTSLKGEYCNNVTGTHSIRSNGSVAVVTKYAACKLSISLNGLFTLQVGDKVISATVDGTDRDLTVGGGQLALDASLSGVYTASAVDQNGVIVIDRVDVGIHRGRVVFASALKPNIEAGPLNEEKIYCEFLNPTQVGNLTETKAVGFAATASDLAANLVGQVTGSATGLLAGVVVTQSCAIKIDANGILSTKSPEVVDGLFSGREITTSVKLNGKGSDNISIGNNQISITASEGDQILTIIVNAATQTVRSSGICQISG
jgi:hypothetical protein